MSKPTLLLIGHGSRHPDGVSQFKTFATIAGVHLGQPVVPAFLELADPPIIAGIEQVIEAGSQHIVALPLFLGPAGHQKNDVPTTINWARERWPDVRFDYGTPLGVHPFIVDTLADRALEVILQQENEIPHEKTALLVLGRGSRDPDSNSNVAKLARLLYEGRKYHSVEYAFYSLTQPGIEESVRRCIMLGAERVVVVPHFLFNGVLLTKTADRLAKLNHEVDTEILLAKHMGYHPQLFSLIRQRAEEAMGGNANMNCDLCKYRHPMTGFESEVGMPQVSDHNHGLRGIVTASLNFDVSRAVPMGSTDLKYDNEGDPDWAGTWQSFCDLALHGGPPHRGNLLEPVSPQDALADPERYAYVVGEIERGLTDVTKLPTVKSDVAGWVGLACQDEEMALWLLQAILVENVFIRREGRILYLPAAPHFTIKEEIKNVITCAAKAVHYWQEHMMTLRGGRI